MTKVATPKLRAHMTGINALDPGLTDISDEQLTCMAEGHDWPKLRLNHPVPKNFRSYPNNDGTELWVYTCSICTTDRKRDTLKYGIYDDLAVFSYNYPSWWIHFKADDEMTRARLKRELSKRLHDALQEQRKLAEKQAKAAADKNRTEQA
jgi:hypothetical protein